MKYFVHLLCVFLFVFSPGKTFAQKKKPCKNLFADLEAGTINKVSPKTDMAKVKKKLPCFTGDSEEGGAMNCGGGVFYLDNDFFFYTGKDYIEIRSDYNGKLSDDVMGKDKSTVRSKYGEPDKKLNGSEGEVFLYKKNYGTLRLYFGEDGRVMEIGMHSVKPKEVELCE